jgi:hypothetical protein
MKKTKLRITRQTLRNLTASDLDNVHGGVGPPPPPPPPSETGCTPSKHCTA